jgi:hypothetical protein
LSNSNIINLNAIYTSDVAESGGEGVQFARSDSKWDSVWAADGVFYFSPGGITDSTTGQTSYSTDNIVIHSGNYTNYFKNYVTTNTVQTISGQKTFSDTIIISSGKGINEEGGHGLLGACPTGWTGLPTDGSAVGVGRVDKKLYFRSSGNNLYHYRQDTQKAYLIYDESNFTPGDSKRLCSYYGTSTDNNMNDRPTSANITFTDKSIRYFLATSSMTEGKPTVGDSMIIQTSWDNNGWNSQLAFPTNSTLSMQWRT